MEKSDDDGRIMEVLEDSVTAGREWDDLEREREWTDDEREKVASKQIKTTSTNERNKNQNTSRN
jgi:hypothetical protein